VNVESLLYSVLFLLLISPAVWYLWRRIDATCDGLQEAVTRDYAEKMRRLLIHPSLAGHITCLETEGVAFYQQKFRTGPVGNWHAHGQEPMLMAEYWEFHADHTGEVIETGMMGYPERRHEFRWREVGVRTIETLVISRQEWKEAGPEGANVWEEPEDVSDEEWERLEYDFRYVSEPSPEVVMHVVGQDDFPHIQVYSNGPLCLDWRQPA